MKASDNILIRYFSSTMEEWTKITWPTKEQAALLTALTIGVSIFFVLLIGVSDLGLSQLYTYLLDLTN